jgi:hypothetical protein
MTKMSKDGGVGKALSSAKSALKSVSKRIPFARRQAQQPSPEPFTAIEDDTPVSDLLSEVNAAPIAAPPPKEKAGIDLGAVANAASKNPIVLAVGIIVLLFLVAVAITILIVNAPPKPIMSSSKLSQEGSALVKTWILPPGDPLEQRIEFEREGAPAYTAADAAKIGLARSAEYIVQLAARNDAAMDDVYGTVR